MLWFCSLLAAVFRCVEKFCLSASVCVPNIVSLFRGIWFIMSMSLLLIGSIRGLLPLVGVMLSVFCSVDRSDHLSFTSSEMRMPVSLSVCNSVAVCFWHDAISWSISDSVGMNGNLVSVSIRGRFQDFPVNFRKASYISAYLLFVSGFHCC